MTSKNRKKPKATSENRYFDVFEQKYKVRLHAQTLNNKNETYLNLAYLANTSFPLKNNTPILSKDVFEFTSAKSTTSIFEFLAPVVTDMNIFLKNCPYWQRFAQGKPWLTHASFSKFKQAETQNRTIIDNQFMTNHFSKEVDGMIMKEKKCSHTGCTHMIQISQLQMRSGDEAETSKFVCPAGHKNKSS